MENRNTILGISKKKVNFVHRIMLITILHSSLIAPAQNMFVDYFNDKEPLHYSTYSSMAEKDKINPSNSISQSVVKNASDESAIADTSEKGFVYSVYADIQNGVIGVSDAHPLDDARDNLFKFYIKELPKENTKIFLTYELFGVQDYNGVSRSINDRLSTGGYVVKNQVGWTSQREEIDLKWLKTGGNKVMFGIPKGANYQYQIKNLKIEFRKEKAKNTIPKLVVNSPTVNYVKDNQLYVKGFLRNYNSDLKVFIEDTPLTIIDGEYEGFLKLTDVIKNRKFIVIKAFDDKGLLGQELMVLNHLAVANQIFVPEKIFEKVASIAKANTSVVVKAEGAAIAIKDNVLTQDKEISISKLRTIDIAPLSSGMINVTKGGYAYRFLPDGTHFEKPVELSLVYDENRIPKGHNANEIKTFYFDTQNKTWVALERDTINKAEKTIVSLTNHFTDYINGIIQTPESPETAGFTPTMMNDIKAVDPSAEMTIISPPEVSQKGDANISYPIKIPAGRKGMQPNLAIQYSNEGANGWLGQGWSLNIPAIAIDTRWGVPQFDATNESEIYTLGGEQLMYPKMDSAIPGEPKNDWMPNRHKDDADNKVSTNPQLRTYEYSNNTKLFTPRKQGSFAKIERLGATTKDYYWKVTATDGTIHWYGGKAAIVPNAVLKNAKGDIVHWGLYLTEDVFGNCMQYEYDNKVLAGNGNLDGGVIFHIKNIKYNGYQGGDYKYEVAFNSSTAIRDDVSINQRLGIKQIEPYILDNIVVKNLATASPIRKYTLKKGTGFFKKSRLEAITEFDWDKNDNKEDKFKEFYTHTFDYYNDVTKPDNTTSIFTPGGSQTVCNDCVADTDIDGVCDTVDDCPTVAGPASNKGCPIVTKCYTVSFPVPKVATIAYRYSCNMYGGGAYREDIAGHCTPHTAKITSFKINNVDHAPPYNLFPSHAQNHDFKDLCPTSSSQITFPSESTQNTSFVTDLNKWIDQLPISAYNIVSINQSNLFRGPDGSQLIYDYCSFITSFNSTQNFSIDLSYLSTNNGLTSLFPIFTLPFSKTPFNTTVPVTTTISVNGTPLQGNPYSLYDNFNQFRTAFQTQYPGSVVSSLNDFVTISVNKTTGSFNNITLAPTNGSTPNTYNFTEYGCDDDRRLTGNNTNKVASTQDDWKSYKPSKEELELGIKKWEAAGNELVAPINEDFPLNIEIDATNNTTDQTVSGLYRFSKDKAIAQWMDSKGGVVTDSKTLKVLNPLLPSDTEKLYADFQGKNKQETIAHRKQHQLKAQAWLEQHYKDQKDSSLKSTPVPTENVGKADANGTIQKLAQSTASSVAANTTITEPKVKFKNYLANLRENISFVLSSGIAPITSSNGVSCPQPPLGNTNFLISGYIPSFDSTSSLLGSSTTEGMSAGFYIGIGVGKGRFTKMTTFGAQFTWGNDESKGLTALIDINGDGLEDMISKEGDALYYKKHLVTRTYDDKNEPVIAHSFEAKRPIYGIDNFYRAFGRSKSTNFQATYGLKKIGGFVGKDKSKSTSETDIYFADGNGDGLMDIVKDGVVYFNRLDKDNPTFSTDSKGTENLVITAATKAVETPAVFTEEDITIPALDVVKVWEAPADGAIKIDNNITLTDPTKEAVVTVEMKVTKDNSFCNTVSFPVPRGVAYRYTQDDSFIAQSISSPPELSQGDNGGSCFVSSLRLNSFTKNGISYNALPYNIFAIHGDDNDPSIPRCPDFSSLPGEPFFTYNGNYAENPHCDENFLTFFNNFISNSNTDIYGDYVRGCEGISSYRNSFAGPPIEPFLDTNYSSIGTAFFSPESFDLEYSVSLGVRTNNGFQWEGFNPDVLIEGGDGSNNLGPFTKTYLKTPMSISTNSNVYLNGSTTPIGTYDLSNVAQFEQFKTLMVATYPETNVILQPATGTSASSIVITTLNPDLISIKIIPVGTGHSNTYTFRSCNSTMTNKFAAKSTNDDWSTLKLSPKETEYGINRWIADGHELEMLTKANLPVNSVNSTIDNTQPKSTLLPSVLNEKISTSIIAKIKQNQVNAQVWIENYYKDKKNNAQKSTLIPTETKGQTNATSAPKKLANNQPLTAASNTSTSTSTSPSALKTTAIALACIAPNSIVVDYRADATTNLEATKSVSLQAGAHLKPTAGTSYVARIVPCNPIIPPGTPYTPPCSDNSASLSLLYGDLLNATKTSVNKTINTNCKGQSLTVKKGDRIYFRTHSVANGNPPVNWNPKVEYTTTGLTTITDANGHTPFSSSYSDGFVLSKKNPARFPGESGTAEITWTPFTVIPTDDITYQIIKETVTANATDNDEDKATVVRDTIYTRVCNRNVPTTIDPIPSTVNLTSISITAPAGIDKNLSQTYFYFKVISTSNVDWKNSVWKPKLKFTANQTISPNKDGSSPEGNVAITSTVYPVPDYDIYKLFSCGPAFTKKDISTLNGGSGLSVKPNLAGIFGSTDSGKINFVVKRGNTWIGSRVFTISGATVSGDATAIPLGTSSSPAIEMMYTIDDSDKGDDGCSASLLNKLVTTAIPLATILNGTTVVSNIGKSEIALYQKAVPKMGSFFRQWGQFMYNPANVTGASPSGFANTYLIKEDALQVVEDQTKTNEINTDLANLETVNQDDENAMDGALQNIKDNHQSYMNKVAFLSANPSRENDANVIIDRWIGFHRENYATDLASQAASLEQSVIDLKEEASTTIQQTDIKTGAYAISKLAKGTSKNFSAGFNLTLGPDTGATASVGVNGSKSNGGSNNTLSDYVDFNGDRYPDIVTTEKIQYTTRTGGLFEAIANNTGNISTATSDSFGFGASGSFSKSSKDGGDTDGTGSGFKRFEGFSGNSGSGISGSFTSGNSITQRVWTDINGDGLADLLATGTALANNVPTEVTNVTLNSGGTTPNNAVTNWGDLPLFKSKSTGISAGLGVNKWQGSVEAGVSMTTSWNNTTNTLADINGDGLLDLVYSDSEANKLSVKINTGNKFVDMGVWNPVYSLNKESATVSTSVNAGVTFALIWRFWGISFKIPAIGINGTPYSISTNKTKKSITDFDGDGYPDLLEENEKEANNIAVYHSKIRRTDMLKTVTNPLGGQFTIDYKVQPIDPNNPIAKWAMSDLEIKDNYDKVNDGADVYKKHFVYENGKYDRRERDFYGYKTVKVEDYTLVSGTPTLYRTSVSNYYNESYFLNGLLDDSYVIKGGDATKKFSRTQNSYEIFKLNATNSGIDQTVAQSLNYDVGGSEGRRSAAVLLTKTVTELYELDSSPQLTTEVIFKYDEKARVREYQYIGNPNETKDDYTSTITYWDDTNLNIRNIINIPRSIIVKVGNTTVRERETEIDPINGNLKKISAKNGTEWAVTTMDDYDSYGNLKKITYPATSAAQSMTYDYTYDPVYNKYVTGITNAFNYTSSAKYNPDFDKIEETTDLAGNIMSYQYDTFGRNTLILGPKERALGTDAYTLKFEYYPYHSLLPTNSGVTYDANVPANSTFVPVAVTKHYDVQRPADPIETYTFIDGLARPIQVKKDISINNGSTVAPIYEAALSVSGKTLYDELGRAKQQFHPYWELKADNKKFLLNETTNMNTQNNTLTEYDELDRPVKSTDPDNNISTMQYSISDVNRVKAIKTLSDVDQNGAQHIITETYKDVAGKVISTNNKGGTSGNIWTKFEYNAIGELKSYTDAANITTSYTYDMLGRKKTLQSPDSGLTSYTYDIAGNLTELQTANLAVQGKKIEYIYDKNRLTNIKYPDLAAGVANLANVDYTYGTTGNQTGRLIKQKDATGLQVFDYDNMGNIIKNDRTIIAPNLPKRQFKTFFTYDSWNRLQTMTYPDGEMVTYSYDLGGNLNKMTGQLNGAAYEYIKRIDYDYFEQKTYMKYGNNTETAYTYSPALRRLSNLNVKTAAGTNLFNNAYGYDKIGNVLSIVNSAGTVNTMGGDYNHTYTYDNLNRLASASGSFTGSATQRESGNDANSTYSLTMAYNDTHGILAKTQTHFKNAAEPPQPFAENTYDNGYAYWNGTHKVSSIIDPNTHDEEYFMYDLNGNLTHKEFNSQSTGTGTESSYFWDESNRLRITTGAQNTMQHYIYDASGDRVLKASSDYSATYENGTLLNTGVLKMNSYTTYPSAFMVVNGDGVYSKHYYAGSQRIVSRLGDATAATFNCSTCPTSKLAKPDKNQAEETALQQAQIADLQRYMDKANKGKVTFTDYSPQLLADQERAIAEEAIAENTTAKTSATAKTTTTPAPIYYYHPDHLGTSTFLTDANGNAYQFFLNLPYGETMAEQLGTNYYNTPYKFNGKELDADTGLYYYGARYYDPHSGPGFLSVDPLAEDYPDVNPYVYCLDNPVRFTDPTGMESEDSIDPPGKKDKTSRLDGWNKTVSEYNNNFNSKVDSFFRGNPFSQAADATLDFFNGAATFVSDAIGLTDALGMNNNTRDAINGVINTIGSVPSMNKEQQGAALGMAAIIVTEIAITEKVPLGKNVGRSGKQARLIELSEDLKVSKADRGWIKNEMRHIETGNRKTIRNPRNSRNSRTPGTELAHPRGQRAKDGHSYKNAKFQDADLHKLEHKHSGYK